jgi:hypothetical protein
MAQSLDATYPTIVRWVHEYGRIEIGQNEFSRSFIRAIDPGGMVWEARSIIRPLRTPCRTWRPGSEHGCRSRGSQPLPGPLHLTA